MSRIGKHAIIYKVLILVGIAGCALYLFRGALSQGMEMDEVLRASNVIPIFHADAKPNEQTLYDLRVGDLTIPIMYKAYISTAYVIRYLPLGFFDDYLFGIRFLHFFYFLVSCSALFLALERENRYLAVVLAFMVASSPLFFPEVRIGFADGLFLFFLSIAFVFIRKFLRSPQERIYLFLTALVLAFAANQMLYFAWIICGAMLTALILYPRQCFDVAREWRNWIAVFLGGGVGLIHYVIYNVLTGFPTVKLLLERILNVGGGHASIDYSTAPPLMDAVAVKLRVAASMFGSYALVYVFVWILAAGTTLILALWLRKRIYLFPFIAVAVILVLILISPRTTRAGHYVYLSPFVELSLVSSFMLVAASLGERRGWLKKALLTIPFLLVVLNFIVSDAQVAMINRTGGTGLFSSATLDFSEYVGRESIDSHDVVFFVWGLYAQPYFLEKGDFFIKNWVYRLIDQREESAHFAVFDRFFRSIESVPRRGDSLYFPMWAGFRTDINESLIQFVEARGGELKTEKVFYQRTGSPSILLYRLDEVREFVRPYREAVRSAPNTGELEIRGYGPNQVHTWSGDGVAMWFEASGLTPTTEVYLGAVSLPTVSYPDRVTARVPSQLLSEASELELFLFDPQRGIRSDSVTLKVRKE